jgi:hypothetical protein
MQGAQSQDAWKNIMHKKAEHDGSTYPSIYNADGDHVSFDEKATVTYRGCAVYTVRVGEDIRCGQTAERVTQFLAERGVDSSKFQ